MPGVTRKKAGAVDSCLLGYGADRVVGRGSALVKAAVHVQGVTRDVGALDGQEADAARGLFRRAGAVHRDLLVNRLFDRVGNRVPHFGGHRTDSNGVSENPVPLWILWWNALQTVRPAFTRLRTFLWFATAVAGFAVRTEHLGMTSIVRALKLRPKCYEALLDNMHSSAVRLDELSAPWTRAVLRLFPNPLRVNGRRVLVGDGIKRSEEHTTELQSLRQLVC